MRRPLTDAQRCRIRLEASSLGGQATLQREFVGHLVGDRSPRSSTTEFSPEQLAEARAYLESTSEAELEAAIKRFMARREARLTPICSTAEWGEAV